MFSNYLSSIDGVSIYPIVSLLLFFAIFMSVVIWVFKMKKSYLDKMGNLPLENELAVIKISEKKDEKIN